MKLFNNAINTTNNMHRLTLFWHRRDLRIEDNCGLFNALEAHPNVQPFFIFDTDIINEFNHKPDRRLSFIYDTIAALKSEYQKHGADLWVLHGKPLDIINQLTKQHPVNALYCNTDYEPYATQRDQQIANFCKLNGIAFHAYKDQVIYEKSEIVKANGQPYTVFTPYKNQWLHVFSQQSLKIYQLNPLLQNLSKAIASPMPPKNEFGFIYTPHNVQKPNIEAATLQQYGLTRNALHLNGTSRVSVHLRFGTISIRSLVQKALKYPDYLNELIWREFYMQWLWHYPQVVTQSFKPQYDKIAWNQRDNDFEKWCQGQTGYLIVDAAMNQLLQTGFMHNRARMIVASFLTKHLLTDWRKGEAFFARHLTDYELSSNVGGWQWAAGSGCDAAPYFRIFNPTLQAQKFDPHGAYIQQWNTNIQAPPIIDHHFARQRCLSAYKKALMP